MAKASHSPDPRSHGTRFPTDLARNGDIAAAQRRQSLSEIAWLVHFLLQDGRQHVFDHAQKLGVRTSVELVRFAIESGVA